MNLQIKCLDCGKKTMKYEINRAVFTKDKDNKILLSDNIVCPKCKKDISNEKCVAFAGTFKLSLIALSICTAMNQKHNSSIPSHLRGISLVDQDVYEDFKKQSKASIRLVDRL